MCGRRRIGVGVGRHGDELVLLLLIHTARLVLIHTARLVLILVALLDADLDRWTQAAFNGAKPQGTAL